MNDDFGLVFSIEKPVWFARLARAREAQDVMDVVHEFVHKHQAVWVSLPIDCQPPPFTVADDVSRYALSLYQKDLDGDSRMAGTVHALAAFFSEAAHRIATVITGKPAHLRRPFSNRVR